MTKADLIETRATRELDRAGLAYRRLPMTGKAYTVEAVARLRGLDPATIVKAMVLEDKSGSSVLVILAGDRRLDVPAVKKLTGQKLKIATVDRAAEITGWPVGAITPLGLPDRVTVLVDLSVAELDKISISSGDLTMGLLLSSTDLLEHLKINPAPLSRRE